MDKISRILPTGRRFQNVEASSSHPVRPGAPDFRSKSKLETANSPLAASNLGQSVQDRVSISAPAAQLIETPIKEEVSESTASEAEVKMTPADLSRISSEPEEKFKDEPSTYKAVKPVNADHVRNLAERFFSPQKETVEPQGE